MTDISSSSDGDSAPDAVVSARGEQPDGLRPGETNAGGTMNTTGHDTRAEPARLLDEHSDALEAMVDRLSIIALRAENHLSGARMLQAAYLVRDVFPGAASLVVDEQADVEPDILGLIAVLDGDGVPLWHIGDEPPRGRDTETFIDVLYAIADVLTAALAKQEPEQHWPRAERRGTFRVALPPVEDVDAVLRGTALTITAESARDIATTASFAPADLDDADAIPVLTVAGVSVTLFADADTGRLIVCINGDGAHEGVLIPGTPHPALRITRGQMVLTDALDEHLALPHCVLMKFV